MAWALRLGMVVMRKPISISKALRGFKNRAAPCLVFFAVLAAVGSLTGCEDNCGSLTCIDTVVVVDNRRPSAPDGVYSVTGDAYITIYWNPNPEPDIVEYDIYWHTEETGYYSYLATVPKDQRWYRDWEVQYRFTKYYAVLARDIEGYESDLSYETVFDTPRPEGENLVLFDYLGQNSSLSGYDFSSLSGTAQAWDSSTTDAYFGTYNGANYLYARAGVDIQDYGLILLEDVDWAPLVGWAPSGRAEMIYGHSYILRIVNKQGKFNYAKIYVSDVSSSFVTLDWAYQPAEQYPGNQELSPGRGAEE